MAEDEAPLSPPESLLRLIDNLARFHREHEEYYSQAPLRQAAELQARSRVLKALADRWSAVRVDAEDAAVGFAGTEDLKAPGLIAESGVLFTGRAAAATRPRSAGRGRLLTGGAADRPGGRRTAPAYLYSASELLDRHRT